MKKLIIGITGASGVQYGIKALEILHATDIETHLIVSRSAEIVLKKEMNPEGIDLEKLADIVYTVEDVGAAIASGSFRTMGMLIAPCTVKTLAEIATGATANLLTRSADVVLKERRRLVLMVRETPLHLGHLRNMVSVTEMGAIVMPPVPAFYSSPDTIEDVITHSVARALDLFGLDIDIPRWK